MEGGGQYPGYMPTCTQSWNNNIPGGPGHVQNSYSLAGHGQPSPLPPGGPQGGQAPVPSPLYPWMRSQFGKKLYFISSLNLSYSSTLSPLSVQTQLTLAGNRRHKSGILAQISSSGLM